MKYLADSFTLLRLMLILPFWVFCQQQRWGLALLMLAMAWATDVVDGPLARKFGSVINRKFSFSNRFIDWDDVDDAVDIILEHCALIIPLFYLLELKAALLAVVVIEAVELVFWTASGLMDESRPFYRATILVYNNLVRMSTPGLILSYLAYGWLGVVVVVLGISLLVVIYRARIVRCVYRPRQIYLVKGGEIVVWTQE